MDDLLFSANAVLPLFLVMAVGYALRRGGLLTGPFLQGANRFCFMVALPALLFKNIYQAESVTFFNLGLIAFTVVGVLVVIGLSLLIVPRLVPDTRKASAMIQGIFRSNVAIFGLPLAFNIFGESGVQTMSILLMVAVPLFNIMAVIVLTAFSAERSGPNTKRLLGEIAGNKLIWGSLAGLVFLLLGWRLPFVVERTVFDIAATATPLAMLSLGGSFSLKTAEENLRYTISASLGRLVLVPLLATAAGVALGFRGCELGGLFIVFASPAATSSYIMAESMGSDGALAGEILVVTTFFSLFTVFAGVYLMRMLNLL